MYTVYKITNKIDGKFYIGVHKTNNPNDSYMGSGTYIKNAIKKHGKENFTKQILFVTEDKDEAYKKEAEMTVDFLRTDSYNLRQGGVGGFTRENALKGNAAALKILTTEQLSSNGKKGYQAIANMDHKELGKLGGLKNKGKPKSEEFKQKLRDVWANKDDIGISIEKIEQIKQLKTQGVSGKAISDVVGVCRNTVMKYWK
jgi:hypothetical protein